MLIQSFLDTLILTNSNTLIIKHRILLLQIFFKRNCQRDL